jgi:hypothetical protein
MPRPPDESRIRRFMMQIIMWVILGATIGLAALVDRHLGNRLDVRLGEPRELPGLTVRLPLGWETEDTSDDPQTLVYLFDRSNRRAMDVRVERPGLSELLGLGGRSRRPTRELISQIPFGDGTGQLTRRVGSLQSGSSYVELTASRGLARGGTLSISLTAPISSSQADLGREIDLIKRVAASVTINSASEPDEP